MTWNWQQSDWPHFTWNREVLLRQEDEFLLGGGVLVGVTKHLSAADWDQVRVEAMSDEAITTSEIEGEMLSRASVQSSIQQQLGLTTDSQRVAPKEQGISELIVDLYGTIDQSLSAKVLFGWHRMVMAGRSDLGTVGSFRTSAAPMQVISGATCAPKVHFEAPPSSRVPEEMSSFLAWFERTAPGGAEPLPAVTRAGIAHLYFESIHPFEDGNCRIGRAIAEKALVHGLGKPIFIGLAHGILARQRSYYEALEAANKKNDLSSWLTWFAAVVIESQASTMANVEFLAEAHILSLQNGLGITVNGLPVQLLQDNLFVSDDIQPSFKEIVIPRATIDGKEGEGVRVKLLAGLSKRDYQEGGWYVFCNGRLILRADKTSASVWGSQHSVQQYHGDFAYFRGYAFFESAHSALLPWTTTKTGVDTDSAVYKVIQQDMIELTKPIIAFLRKIAKDQHDGQIEEGALDSELAKATATRTETLAAPSTFIANFKTAPAAGPRYGRIQYSRPMEEIDRAKSLMKVRSFKEVGEVSRKERSR